MERYKNKYRIQSHRMPGWDYSGNGIYFITLVTQNRICHLGQINNGEMTLSAFGKIVETQWHQSFKIRNELFLDELIIMPNHIHAIIILEKNETGTTNHSGNQNDLNGLHGANESHESHESHVETHGRASLQSNQSQSNQNQNQSNQSVFVRKPKSISSFVAGFKSAVNSKIDDYIDENHLNIPKYNRNNHFFQPNYHDHIIRNNIEYRRIKEYIINNPFNWNEDKFYNE
jgi:REP element-mobilizing transposase RayT